MGRDLVLITVLITTLITIAIDPEFDRGEARAQHASHCHVDDPPRLSKPTVAEDSRFKFVS